MEGCSDGKEIVTLELHTVKYTNVESQDIMIIIVTVKASKVNRFM